MQNSSPLVSILMTAFNREKYIAQAIESILNSTYENFELIIVDDCSKDNTIDIARTYADKDKRINLFKNSSNLGDYPNRNRAASYAKGKYLKYIDADDCIYKYGLEIMIENMERFPQAGWGLMSFQQDEAQMYPIILTPYEAYARNYLIKDPLSSYRKIFSRAPLSAIIQRRAFEESKGFNPVRFFGDGDLWNRLGRKFPVLLMQDGLIWYRKHEDQEQKKEKADFALRIRSWNNIKEHLTHSDCPLSPESVKPILKQIKIFQVKNIIRSFFKTKSLFVLKELYKELNSSSIR